MVAWSFLSRCNKEITCVSTFACLLACYKALVLAATTRTHSSVDRLWKVVGARLSRSLGFMVAAIFTGLAGSHVLAVLLPISPVGVCCTAPTTQLTECQCRVIDTRLFDWHIGPMYVLHAMCTASRHGKPTIPRCPHRACAFEL